MNYFLALLCLSFVSFATTANATTVLSYSIIAEQPHHRDLFTQGLFISKGHFYESSGYYGESFIATYPVRSYPVNSQLIKSHPVKSHPVKSNPDKSHSVEELSLSSNSKPLFKLRKPLPNQYFAEGFTEFNGKFYLLTWKEGKLLVYDKKFALLASLNYQGEGWGLTHNGKQLIRSDGSDRLFFHEPNRFTVEKTIAVHLNDEAIGNLNELEYIDGFIWANIWQDNRIIKINPENGDVAGVLDLNLLVARLKMTDPEAVLNGIAYDEEQNALWITGKLWPTLFLLKIN